MDRCTTRLYAKKMKINLECRKTYAFRAQEARRKDVDRIFEVLLARFSIVQSLLVSGTTCKYLDMLCDPTQHQAPLTMKILTQSSSLASTHAAFKHFMRRAERLKIEPPIISSRRISLGILAASWDKKIIYFYLNNLFNQIISCIWIIS